MTKVCKQSHSCWNCLECTDTYRQHTIRHVCPCISCYYGFEFYKVIKVTSLIRKAAIPKCMKSLTHFNFFQLIQCIIQVFKVHIFFFWYFHCEHSIHTKQLHRIMQIIQLTIRNYHFQALERQLRNYKSNPCVSSIV